MKEIELKTLQKEADELRRYCSSLSNPAYIHSIKVYLEVVNKIINYGDFLSNEDQRKYYYDLCEFSYALVYYHKQYDRKTSTLIAINHTIELGKKSFLDTSSLNQWKKDIESTQNDDNYRDE